MLTAGAFCVDQVEAAFQVDGVRSAAAVCASRPAAGGADSRQASRDLLLLFRDGELALHVGQRRLAGVCLQPRPAAPPPPSPGGQQGLCWHPRCVTPRWLRRGVSTCECAYGWLSGSSRWLRT